MRTANIVIHQAALTHNLALAQQLTPTAKVLAMVKANAYGHGVEHCLPALQEADAIGVATMAEARQAKTLGWHKPIVLIEGAFSEEEWQQSNQLNCQCVIHQHQQVDWALNSVLSVLTPQTLWLKYNTGMNRLGFSTDDVLPVAKQLHAAGYHIILTSHFANADDASHPLNQQQIGLFTQMLHTLKHEVADSIEGSLCNSAGMVNFPDCHFDWVRPGIFLYGSSPILQKTAQQLNLQAAMSLHARLITVQPLTTGNMVGYGSRWVAKKDGRIGIVSIGYGDGYPRVVDASAWVAVRELEKKELEKPAPSHIYRCPVIGRVSMDMIMIDLSHVPDTVGQGAQVILWGNDASLDAIAIPHAVPHIDDIAAAANTISYELMCRLTNRPTRITKSLNIV